MKVELKKTKKVKMIEITKFEKSNKFVETNLKIKISSYCQTRLKQL